MSERSNFLEESMDDGADGETCSNTPALFLTL